MALAAGALAGDEPLEALPDEPLDEVDEEPLDEVDDELLDEPESPFDAAGLPALVPLPESEERESVR
ncbi:hypothetical protein [Micromonospora sp. NPDC126480]|uniref:hypothetical protein n=1 Tax=Micromonospora sp. NPDC126480 TaxID=3155312 RepID=UPI00331E55B8